jgi:hypothetical protein
VKGWKRKKPHDFFSLGVGLFKTNKAGVVPLARTWFLRRFPRFAILALRTRLVMSDGEVMEKPFDQKKTKEKKS